MKTAPRAHAAIIAAKLFRFPKFGVPALAGGTLGAPASAKWSTTGMRSGRRLKAELRTKRSAAHFSAWAVALLALTLLLFTLAPLHAGEPVNPVEFRHARITDAWKKYAGVLTFGRGQTLALVDDGCKLARP